MNYDNLVNFIVEEIYNKINLNIEKNKQLINKEKAVLLFSKKEEFNFLEDEFDLVQYDETVKDADIVIISKLCMRGLSNLALGNSTSEEERFILKMLMKGKKVYVLNDGIEYKKYKDTAPKALYNKYLSYEDEICKFGVEIIKNIKDITSNDAKNIKMEFCKKAENISTEKEICDEFSLDLRNKKLISEADLRKPTINGVKDILVDKKSIITPLAVDFLRIHRLNLKKM